MDALSIHLQIKIVRHLPLKDLLNCRLVCHSVKRSAEYQLIRTKDLLAQIEDANEIGDEVPMDKKYLANVIKGFLLNQHLRCTKDPEVALDPSISSFLTSIFNVLLFRRQFDYDSQSEFNLDFESESNSLESSVSSTDDPKVTTSATLSLEYDSDEISSQPNELRPTWKCEPVEDVHILSFFTMEDLLNCRLICQSLLFEAKCHLRSRQLALVVDVDLEFTGCKKDFISVCIDSLAEDVQPPGDILRLRREFLLKLALVVRDINEVGKNEFDFYR